MQTKQVISVHEIEPVKPSPDCKDCGGTGERKGLKCLCTMGEIREVQPEITHVYLCHKCSGLLGEAIPEGTNLRLKPGHGLHGCGCMSGWVRDWQSPVTIEAALADQARNKAYMEKFRAEQEARIRS